LDEFSRSIFGALSDCPAMSLDKQADFVARALWPTVATLTPPAEPVSRPAGEGEREAVAMEIYDYLNERFPEGAMPGGVQLFADPGDHTDADMKHEAGCFELADRIIALLSPAAPDAGGGSLGPLGKEPDSALKIATDLHAAYEQLIYGLPKYLDAENLTDEENMIREAYITLDVTAHRLAALPGGER